MRENAEFLSISSDVVRESNQFQRNILYMERALKGYMLTGEEYLLQTYHSASIQNNTLLNELTASIHFNSTQLKKINEIKRLYNEWIEQFAKPIMASKPDTSASYQTTLKPQQLLKGEEKINIALQQQFRELLNVEYASREKKRIIMDKNEQKTKVISVILTVFSIVTGFIIAVLLARHISRRISKMVKMSNSIAEGNYKVNVEDKGNDELSELTRSLNRMAEMLEETISLLQRKNKELDQFAYIVSHDLKAPLRGIDNLISWVQEDYANQLPSGVQEYLDLVKGRVTRSENLIQGILTYARVGKEVKEHEEIKLTALIDEILENLPVKQGIHINVQKDMPVIYSEKIPLMQIFTNLISNAIKYHNKEKGEIKVYSKEQKNNYEFFVEDDGPGIASSHQKKIFMIFQTLQDRDSFESTGVGLAIVKKILDDRKEQIKILSEPGKGSVFSFTWSKI
ncbi:ATP-binding protein [Segetibacter koreensis]|uniref:ATP-binding protein n=1 Tax=Segetibacter koreensis TaxID=398037 RepID=UPI0006873135|nr:ATP-binding protein [Segetibacter koreensis]